MRAAGGPGSLAASLLVLLLRVPARAAATTFQCNALEKKAWVRRRSCFSYSRTYASTPSSADFANWSNLSPVTLSRPLVICGPSGAGKGTLIKHLLAEHPTRFGFSVSHTSRKARPGEEEGVDYFFTPKETLTAAIEAGGFLEHAMVHGNLYGTSFDAIRRVQQASKICILDIDVQGVKNIKAAEAEGRADGLKPVYVFIAPPSLEELESRLRGRHTENETEILRRLGNARGELEYGMTAGNFHHVVVNDQVQRAYNELKSAILSTYTATP